jgi:hypothetical protein
MARFLLEAIRDAAALGAFIVMAYAWAGGFQ